MKRAHETMGIPTYAAFLALADTDSNRTRGNAEMARANQLTETEEFRRQAMWWGLAWVAVDIGLVIMAVMIGSSA